MNKNNDAKKTDGEAIFNISIFFLIIEIICQIMICIIIHSKDPGAYSFLLIIGMFIVAFSSIAVIPVFIIAVIQLLIFYHKKEKRVQSDCENSDKIKNRLLNAIIVSVISLVFSEYLFLFPVKA